MPNRMIVRGRLLVLCAVVGFLGSYPRDLHGETAIVLDAQRLTVRSGERRILQYRYANVPFKPYVETLFSPNGINVLRDSPHDHKHHHSLMFAVAVDGTNFWEEQTSPGVQLHQKLGNPFVREKPELRAAGFNQELNWLSAPTRQPFIHESRSIRWYPNQKVTLVTWESELRPSEGKVSVTLTGSEYFGLGMRFLTSMDKGGTFWNSEHEQAVLGTNAHRAKWCAYSAAADGKPVTVAVFDHPANPRYPATWFTMDSTFAYLAATLNLKHEPLVLPSAHSMRLRYGVALWDGTIKTEEIEAIYQTWIRNEEKLGSARSASQPGN